MLVVSSSGSSVKTVELDKGASVSAELVEVSNDVACVEVVLVCVLVFSVEGWIGQ